MYWLINLILLVTSCHLGQTNIDVCISRIDWRQLWKIMDSLNEDGVSEECFDIDQESLCEPTRMNIQVVSHKKGIILPILTETVKIFQKETVPFPNRRDFVEFNYGVEDELATTLQNDPTNTTTLEGCFQKMEGFLNQQQNSKCAWEIIQQDCMAILQQVEFYTAPSTFGK